MRLTHACFLCGLTCASLYIYIRYYIWFAPYTQICDILSTKISQEKISDIKKNIGFIAHQGLNLQHQLMCGSYGGVEVLLML